jgi:hypothetical protein
MSWTYKGNTISQPGIVAVIDNSGISGVGNTNSRELVLIGSAGGGSPKEVLSFSDADTAMRVLQSGNGLTAVVRALRPSKDQSVTPGTVKFVRVDPALQSSYDVLSSGVTVLELETVGYGEYTKQANTWIQVGSVRGLKASITLNAESYTQDNIFSDPFQIQYLGASASGVVTVSNSAGTITGLSGVEGAETQQWQASFSAFPTLQALINYINGQAGWTATLLTGNGSGATADYFDDCVAQSCKASAYVVTATLDALKNFFDGSGLVTANRPAGVGGLPSAMIISAYFTGGSNGTTTNSDWSSALQALQNAGLARIVVALSDQSVIHAMVDAHCNSMSLPTVLKNRVQIAGGALGESVNQVVARASALNSRRTTLVYPGIQDIDSISQKLTTYAPWIVAAQAGAILSASSIVQALTHKEIAAKGLEGGLQKTLQDSDYDTLTDSGVMSVKFKQNQNTGTSYQFVRSVTTWMQDTKLVNQELSMVCNEDYVDLKVANAINDRLVANPGSPIGVGQVVSTIDGALRECFDEGSIVGDTITDAYSNITVNLAQGAVTGGYKATIPAPMNFFGITASFQIYAKSVQIGA